MDAVVNAGAIDGALLPVEVVTIQTKREKDFSLHKWGQMIVPAETSATA
jgi:hypothetical protein